jgi:hypothetical protein
MCAEVLILISSPEFQEHFHLRGTHSYTNPSAPLQL